MLSQAKACLPAGRHGTPTHTLNGAGALSLLTWGAALVPARRDPPVRLEVPQGFHAWAKESRQFLG